MVYTMCNVSLAGMKELQLECTTIAGGMQLPSEAASASGARASLGYASAPAAEGEAHARALQAAEASIGDAGMKRVWAFFDATSTWLAVRDAPPDVTKPLAPEAAAKSRAEYLAVLSTVVSFTQQLKTAYAQRGSSGPLTELQAALPQTLAGGLCVSGTTDSGLDLAVKHDELIHKAMQDEAALFGPSSLTSSHRLTRRSALNHLSELSLCDLWRPHTYIQVAPTTAAAGAAATMEAAAGPSGAAAAPAAAVAAEAAAATEAGAGAGGPPAG